MDPASPGPSVTISAIKAVAHGHQRLLELSDGRHLVFSEDAIEHVGVRVGLPATAELFAALEAADHRAAAHEAALRLLSTRARSERELRTRLAMRGHQPESIDDEINRLRRAGLIDDQRFAEAWVAHRQQNAPRGRQMLRYELLGRGIDPDAASAATEDLDDRTTAVQLARRRARSGRFDSYDTYLARVGGFLRRRGFTYEVASDAARTVWEEIRPGEGRDDGAEDP